MIDIRGEELRNRSIVVLVDPFSTTLAFGVIDQIYKGYIQVHVVRPGANERAVTIDEPHKLVLQVRHTQLPDSIRERLIELSKVRLQ